MVNLYRCLHRLKWLFKVSLSCALVVHSVQCQAKSPDPFIAHLSRTIPAHFDHPEIGVSDPQLNQDAHAIWKQIMSQGYAALNEDGGKKARTLFVQIQAHLERELLGAMSDQDRPAVFQRGLWIIHAPLIATPVVSEGELNGHLVAEAVLKDTDKTRLNTALSRTRLMREFLDSGGVLIIAYNGAHRQGEKGRTAQQVAIFEKLKQQYPAQLIDFPIDGKKLPKGEYPMQFTGATYIMQEKSGQIFAITNRGMQINDTRAGGQWGVWLQSPTQPESMATQQLQTIFNFLRAVGLQEALVQHAQTQGIEPKNYLTLLADYWQQ